MFLSACVVVSSRPKKESENGTEVRQSNKQFGLSTRRGEEAVSRWSREGACRSYQSLEDTRDKGLGLGLNSKTQRRTRKLMTSLTGTPALKGSSLWPFDPAASATPRHFFYVCMVLNQLLLALSKTDRVLSWLSSTLESPLQLHFSVFV